MKINTDIPILGFVGFSGTGKTTLLKKLLPMLTEKGVRVGMIKHAHHQFDIDKPGKDSYELRKAGASQMLVASSKRWALMVENESDQEDPELGYLLKQLDTDKLDLILIEGFKYATYPKIELHRKEMEQVYLFPNDDSIIAIASEVEPDIQPHPDWLDINNPDEICHYILANQLEQKPNSTT